VKRRALAVFAALPVCADAPAAAPGDSLLAFQRVGGWVVLERLDPLTLRPPQGAPRPLRVGLASRDGQMEPQLAWSLDGRSIAVGGDAIELIDPTGSRRARTVVTAPRGAFFSSIGWSSAGTILAALVPAPTAP
jgi:hypothetical protein